MKIIKGMNKGDPHDDMMKLNLRHWCKAYFSTQPKCDIIDNNLAETFNGWILQVRTKAIVSMLKDIRVAIMRRIHEKKIYADKWSGDIAPRIMKKLNDNKKVADNCSIDWNGV
ncbi:hypothetical protein CFOL_v3_20904 [Cephalotus follicularis]|uniref:Uncharacterized protein n=1 Tax=Cephalotus follicularis TaxID=3775 RepID=A0A1Q3CBF5_CEPFO|nr:hypothetical protein CFOL_v3_20904 [Cephalotus follicularis]